MTCLDTLKKVALSLPKAFSLQTLFPPVPFFSICSPGKERKNGQLGTVMEWWGERGAGKPREALHGGEENVLVASVPRHWEEGPGGEQGAMRKNSQGKCLEGEWQSG